MVFGQLPVCSDGYNVTDFDPVAVDRLFHFDDPASCSAARPCLEALHPALNLGVADLAHPGLADWVDSGAGGAAPGQAVSVPAKGWDMTALGQCHPFAATSDVEPRSFSPVGQA